MSNPNWVWKFRPANNEEMADYCMTMFETFKSTEVDRGRPFVTEWVHPDHMRTNQDWQKKMEGWLYPNLEKIGHFLGNKMDRPTKDIVHGNMWMYRYANGGRYGWHGHDQALAFIYYVKLQDPSHATILHDPWNQKAFHVDVEEGDVVVFPSFIMHTAPRVDSGEKVMVAGNFNFRSHSWGEMLDTLPVDF